MIRKNKKYARPRKPFDKLRIEEENVLKDRYGLKNKREIWKADSAISKVRERAKKLITKSDEEKNVFIEKLQRGGFKVASIPDVLALNKEDWLKRRLQTILSAKKLANSPKQARQFVVHKHVSINDRIVNIPSYQVSSEEETGIKLNLTLKVQTKKDRMTEIKEQAKVNE